MLESLEEKRKIINAIPCQIWGMHNFTALHNTQGTHIQRGIRGWPRFFFLPPVADERVLSFWVESIVF